MSSCNICCEPFNKSTRSKVCCPFCDFLACRSCCETYVLSESVPKCMNTECGKTWTRKFMREQFTSVFLNSKYKQHLENLLFEEEKALMPATQIIVEERIAKQKQTNQIKELTKLINDLIQERRALEIALQQGVHSSQERRSFIRQCPANQCRGFLSTQWKCGICEQWTCPECHELKGPNRDCGHVCDPNNVETAKLLAKDSKPCPKCQCLIYKISGCSQMWCTQCHTAFCWKTGKLESNIHNPHYYEWQRQNGGLERAQGDVECGRDLVRAFSQVKLLSRQHPELCHEESTDVSPYRNSYTYLPELEILMGMIRTVVHNNEHERPQFQTNPITRNQDLRVQYMENRISLQDFKTAIQRNDKRTRKNAEILQIFHLAHTAFTDIVYRLIDELEKNTATAQLVIQLFGEVQHLIEYCNDVFADIAFVYNCSTLYAFQEDTFMFRRTKKRVGKKDAESVCSDILDSDDDSHL